MGYRKGSAKIQKETDWKGTDGYRMVGEGWRR